MECRDLFNASAHTVNGFREAVPNLRSDLAAALDIVSGREGGAQRNEAVRRIRFKRANLQRADLRLAKLRNSSLQFVRLDGADLRDADLSGADLYRARLDGAYLDQANINGANLCSSVLIGVDYGDDATRFYRALNNAFGDEFTVLPNGIDRPPHWAEALTRWQDVYLRWKLWREGRGTPVVSRPK